jgi:hypothetical protein
VTFFDRNLALLEQDIRNEAGHYMSIMGPVIVTAFAETVLTELVQFLRGASDNAVSLEQTASTTAPVIFQCSRPIMIIAYNLLDGQAK